MTMLRTLINSLHTLKMKREGRDVGHRVQAEQGN